MAAVMVPLREMLGVRVLSAGLLIFGVLFHCPFSLACPSSNASIPDGSSTVVDLLVPSPVLRNLRSSASSERTGDESLTYFSSDESSEYSSDSGSYEYYTYSDTDDLSGSETFSVDELGSSNPDGGREMLEEGPAQAEGGRDGLMATKSMNDIDYLNQGGLFQAFIKELETAVEVTDAEKTKETEDLNALEVAKMLKKLVVKSAKKASLGGVKKSAKSKVKAIDKILVDKEKQLSGKSKKAKAKTGKKVKKVKKL